MWPWQSIATNWNDHKETFMGKLAVILFYSLIWIFILRAFYYFFFPYQSAIHCIFPKDNAEDAYSMAWNTILLRQHSLAELAFFLYVETTGLTLWNTCRFFGALVLYLCALYAWVIPFDACVGTTTIPTIWIVCWVWPCLLVTATIVHVRTTDTSFPYSGWNIVMLIREQMRNTVSLWGGIAVVLFHFFVFVVVFKCIYFMFDPTPAITCVDDPSEAQLAMVRISSLFALFIMTIATLRGATTYNLLSFALLSLVSYFHSFVAFQQVKPPPECFGETWSFYGVVYVLGIGLICSLIEERAFAVYKASVSEEEQDLVQHAASF